MNENKDATKLIHTQHNVSENWITLQQQAKAFLMSGYLREEFSQGRDEKTTIAKVITIITMGEELGIGRMQALRSINVIKGKPALSSELMLALCFKKIAGFKASFITPPEKQHEECTIVVQRPGGDASTFRFTISEARAANLVQPNSGWTKYPADMCRARAISRAVRAMAPDATMGLSSLEEMGHDVFDVESEAKPVPTIKSAAPKPVEPIIAPHEIIPTTEELAADAMDAKYDKRGFPHGEYPPASRNWTKERVTEAQVKKLWAMGKKAGYDDSQLHELAGVEHFEFLVKEQIQDLFLILEKEINDRDRQNTFSPPTSRTIATSPETERK